MSGYCEQCGAALGDGAKFCASCGTEVGSSPASAAPSAADSTPKSPSSEPGSGHAPHSPPPGPEESDATPPPHLPPPSQGAASSAPTPPKSDWPLSTGWSIVLGVLTAGLGLLVPLAIYFWRRGQRTGAYITAAAFGLLVLIIAISSATGGSNSKTAKQSTPPTQTHAATTSAPPPTTTAPAKKPARFVLRVGKSACGEDPSLAYINCHVAVSNRGGTAADDPDVYVYIRYSDGGDKIIDNTTDPYSDSDQPGKFTIYPHTTRVIYLQHSYDATTHDLVQAAASLNLNAKNYPYITCVAC